MKTLAEFMESKPEPELLSCGHESDYFDQEAQYKLDGKRVCADCYFDAIDHACPVGHGILHRL